MFSLMFAELFKFDFRSSLGNIDLGTVISLTALFTFEPNIFSFFSLGHFAPV